MLVDKLLALLGKDESSVDYVEDRLGHDRRYSVDIAKITALGWTKRRTLDEALGGDRRLVPRQRVVVAPAQVGPSLMRVLITGAAGQLGTDLVRTCHEAGDEVIACGAGRARPHRSRLGARRPSPRRGPDVVLHAGAWTAVDACESRSRSGVPHQRDGHPSG